MKNEILEALTIIEEEHNRTKRDIEIIKQAKQEIERLHSIIKEVREYIENNSLYEQDYDYDYGENLVEYPPSDERARKDILEILDKGE